jgi:iron(II)-dependent oxidoreductase
MTTSYARQDTRVAIRDLLEETRARTMWLVRDMSEDDLLRQHDPLMSPMLWDLGHIVAFEELWLTQNITGDIRFGEMPGTYNPFEHPRRTRGALRLSPLAECVDWMRDVRERVLDRLEDADLDSGPRLTRDGFVYQMVAQHEQQHNETILQTLQLKQGAPHRARREYSVPAGPRWMVGAEMVRFPGGLVEIGTDDRAVAYDNERPRHAVNLAPFWIDAAPISNADFLRFMEAGGYGNRSVWSGAGWAWVQDAGVRAPKYWALENGAWQTRSMDRSVPAALDHPVCHVSFHEADAYARWAGKRLPTEFEWETAARWNPATGESRPFPWGDAPLTPAQANVDHMMFGTAPIGCYRANVSPLGCYGMIGDVWEWTSSDFGPYPGYETFPYAEYSKVFFGDEYKVLRGGSWATRPLVARTTFRNWDYPIRRQIFSGFRCARDD